MRSFLTAAAALTAAAIAGSLVYATLFSDTDTLWQTAVVSVFSVLAPNVLLVRLLCGKPTACAPAENYSRFELPAYCFVTVAAASIAGEVNALFTKGAAANVPHSAADIAALAVYTLVLAPLAEEYVFRGCIMSCLKPHGTKLAVVVQAVLFALYHADVSKLGYTFMLGLFLGVTAVRSGSLWASMAVHIFNNILAMVIPLLPSAGILPDIIITLCAAAGMILLTVQKRLYLPESKGDTNGTKL